MSEYGYKLVFCDATSQSLALIKVEIPDDAMVVHPMLSPSESSKKYRCNKFKFVEVLACYDFYFTEYSVFGSHDTGIYSIVLTSIPVPRGLIFRSIQTPIFEYQLNQTCESDLDCDFSQECAQGLHFFLKPEDAIEWLEHETNVYWIKHKWVSFSRAMDYLKEQTNG